MKPLNVAFIGAGAMANEHLKVYAAMDNVNLTAIHSRTLERAQKLAQQFGIAQICQSVEALHEQSQADLVIVAVPELACYEVAEQCFRYPWAVFMEKPVGYDFDEAQKIVALARQFQTNVMVGLNRRFYSSVNAVLAELAQSQEKRFIRIQDQQSFSEARHYNHPEDVVQKFMYANSIHNIDLINTFARGAATKITPIMPWQGENTEVMLVHIEFDSGDTAVYEGIWRGPGPWSCSISTPSKRFELQPLERATVQNQGERTRQPLPLDDMDRQFKAGFYCQAQEVIKKTLKQPSQAIDLEESFKTMRLIHTMFGV